MDNMENNHINDAIEFSKNLKEQSNSNIVKMLDNLSNHFNITKNVVINLTYELDQIEELYNTILKEYNKRQNG
jgi:uncharacterized protein YdaL